MLITIALTIIVAIALYILLKKWYGNLPVSYAATSLSPAFFEDWTGTLNLATQRYTVEQYCHLKGYDYLAPTNDTDYGSCLYNETTCRADSNPHWVMCSPVSGSTTNQGVDNSGKPCNLDQKPYLEWHTGSDGIGRCVTSQFPPGFISQVCEAKGLGPWYPGVLRCDSSGYCGLDNGSLPTCHITSDYCDSMGMDYGNGSDGLGDCDINDVQNVFEGIFGKTVTRTFKRNTEAMIRECSDSVFSGNCAAAIGTDLTTLHQISIEFADAEFKDYMDNLKSQCTGDIYASPSSFGGCFASMFPGFFLSQQAISFADGMLNGALGWIPGMPNDLLEKGMGYVSQYGMVAMNAIFHAGEAAVHAFDVAGDDCYYALQKVGLGPVGDLARGVIGNIITFGKQMAGIIANVVGDAINLFVNTIAPVAYHVFQSISDAVLHPKEFFSNVAQDVAGFFKDPVGSIKSAITGIANIGSAVLSSVKAVIGKLVDIAGQVLGDLSSALIDIANHIADAFKTVGNDIKNVADDIGSFFSSIF